MEIGRTLKRPQKMIPIKIKTINKVSVTIEIMIQFSFMIL